MLQMAVHQTSTTNMEVLVGSEEESPVQAQNRYRIITKKTHPPNKESSQRQ